MATVISPPNSTAPTPAPAGPRSSTNESTPPKRSNSMPSANTPAGLDHLNAREQLKRDAVAAAQATKKATASSDETSSQSSNEAASSSSSSSLGAEGGKPGNSQPALSSSPDETDLSSGPSTPTLSYNNNNNSATAVNDKAQSFVPQYPYNVQMTQHLNGPTPDDSEISSRLPSICVDYLSHDWSEDDVWTSWKAMTRHKAEIANGVRLENASWRTWAKQRGNLKTISPETLNWLKDSDVTWLYGPLHTAVDAVPPPKVATASDRLGLEPLKAFNRPVEKDSPRSKSMPLPAVSGPPTATPTIPTSDASAATQQQPQSQKEQKQLQLSPKERRKEKRKGLRPSKSILKHRSLSELLLNQPPVTSPMFDNNGLEYFNVDSTSSISHNRSDSNLSRQGSLRRGKPREASPDPSLVSDSSVSGRQDSSASTSSRPSRHISFNHRVEQCIAVDQEQQNAPTAATGSGSTWHGGNNNHSKYPSIEYEDEEMDDDDDVLTFKSSPKVATGATGADADLQEPAIIARLGPTTLKGTEAYPSPSPAIVYPNYPTMNSADGDMPLSVYGPPRSSYSTDGLRGSAIADDPATSAGEDDDDDPSATPRAGQTPVVSHQDLASNKPGNVARASWEAEEDDDYGMGYDYFAGPDVSVGDEYDMAQYGSQHLVPGTHNNYGAPSQTSASYTNSYSGETSPTPSSPHDQAAGSTTSSSQSSSTESSPSQSRLSSSSPVSASPGGRGPYSPPTSRDQPKRGILKPRSRESSSGSGGTGAASILNEPRFAGAINVSGSSPTTASGSPIGASSSSSSYSPASGSPIGSPRSSSSSLSTAMAQNGVPIRGGGSSLRRNGSDNDFLRGSGETRGRSTSRGSSSSLERSNSSDRRVSSSPNTSYLTSRPSVSSSSSSSSSSSGAAGQQASGGLSIGRRYGSSDSLNSGNAPASSGLARSMMPGVPEASESETDVSLSKPPADEAERWRREKEKDEEEIDLVEDVEDGRAHASAAIATPAAVAGAPAQDLGLPTAPSLIALPPASSSSSTTSTAGPTFRQPSPSGVVIGDAATGNRPPSRSLSNSPNLDPVDLASAHWSDETPVPSYARRSLLRAAARGSSSHSPGTGSSREDSLNGRSSMDSGRSASSGPDDYGYGYYDEDDDVNGPVVDGANVDGLPKSSRRRALGHHHHHHHHYRSGSSASDQNDGAGLVGRTLEVAGTARDLIGAITKGLWNMGRRSTSAPSTTVTTANATGSTSTGGATRPRSQDDLDADNAALSAASVAMHKRAKSS